MLLNPCQCRQIAKISTLSEFVNLLTNHNYKKYKIHNFIVIPKRGSLAFDMSYDIWDVVHRLAGSVWKDRVCSLE